MATLAKAPAAFRTGFCEPGGDPTRCPGRVYSAGRWLRCAGPYHEAQPTCVACRRERPVDPETLTCADGADCAETLHARLVESRSHQLIEAIRHSAREARRERREAQREASDAPIRPRRDPRPTSGRCEHCGSPTGGGRFASGHDAKLKSLLLSALRGEAGWPVPRDPLRAGAELAARGWVKALWADQITTEMRALAATADEWLPAVVAARQTEAGGAAP